MKTTLALPVAAALFLLPAAAAPSFDCAKAATTVEKAICGSTALSAADRKLADSYNALLGRVSEPVRAALRNAQRQWLSYVRTLCAKPMHDDTVEACLTSSYDERQKQLATAITRAGGLTFVRDSLFEARRETGEDEKEPWYQPYSTFESAWPVIDAPKGKSEEQFNKAMAGAALVSARAFKRGGTDFWFTYDDIAVTDRLISVDTTTSFYGHGAAHPNYGTAMVHWLRTEARLLNAEDVFVAGSKWKTVLRDYCFEKVKREGFVEKAEDIQDTTSNPQSWRFSKQGLTVLFNPYEVASYAEGMQQVFVPWSVLKPYLKKNAPVPP